MTAIALQSSVPSLADVSVGQTVVIGDVLFELVRQACAPLVGRRGQTVRCASRDASTVVLLAEDGSRISVDPFYARFVEVERRRPA